MRFRSTDLAAALKLTLHELWQIHDRKYPDCKEGCPSCEAMTAARDALAGKKLDIAELQPSIDLATTMMSNQ